MATFEAQVESLTGLSISGSSNPTQTELSSFLVDGVKDVIHRMIEARPEELVRFTTTTNSASSIAKVGKILSVVREHDSTTILRRCTPIPPADRYEATNTSSLLYRSKYSPGFYELNGSIHTVPEAASGNNDIVVTQIFYDTGVAYGDEVPDNFPESYAHLVALYAAIQSLQSKMSSAIIAITAVTPDIPTISEKSVTITGTAPTYTSPTTNISGVAWATEYPAQASAITTALAAINTAIDSAHSTIASMPTAPTAPTLTSVTFTSLDSDIDATAPTTSTTAVAAASTYTGSAPTFTKPTIQGDSDELTDVTAGTLGSAETDFDEWFHIAGQYIEDQEDTELAGAQLQKITAYINAFGQEMQSAMHTFNQANVAYQSAIQESMQEVQIANAGQQQDAKAALQVAVDNEQRSQQRQLQNATNDMQAIIADNDDKISKYQADTAEYSAQVSKVIQQTQGYIGTAEGFRGEINARLALATPKVSEYGAKVQDALNAFNDANIEYQALLQKDIQDAQLLDANEARKLQKYQAEVAEYQAAVTTEVQEQTTQMQQYQLLRAQLQEEYRAAFKERVAEGG